jgi:cell division protein ZapB
MSSKKQSDGAELDLDQLETRVDDLIRTISQLRNENISLRTRQEDLMSERAALIEKSEQAKSRLESMIGRLKSMESK